MSLETDCLQVGMPFDETDVNRAHDGRFSQKLGSAPTFQLRQWPVQYARFDRDEVDAKAIYDVAVACAPLMDNAATAGAARKQVRHMIEGIWQGPRLSGPMVGRIRPIHVPWSQGARDAYFDKNTNGNLRLEHMTPMKVYLADLMERIRGGEISDGQGMLDHLRTTHEDTTVVAILSDVEDNAVSRAGYKSKLPDDGDPWGRYEAGGMSRDSFMTLTDDPRWPERAQA